jgi:hypothetical protein
LKFSTWHIELLAVLQVIVQIALGPVHHVEFGVRDVSGRFEHGRPGARLLLGDDEVEVFVWTLQDRGQGCPRAKSDGDAAEQPGRDTGLLGAAVQPLRFDQRIRMRCLVHDFFLSF